VPAPQGPPPAPPRRSRLRRTLRALAWSFGGLIVLVLAIAAGAWWWLGSDQSLAAALARAARYLPAGHTLEARDVTGSVRAGGHIGWLRWQGPTLTVPRSEFESPAPLASSPVTLEDAERDHILRALEQTGWVIGGTQGAAARLGLKRTSLVSTMRRLGIVRLARASQRDEAPG